MDLEKYMIPCMNKKLFGFDCPGCGTQRALALIMEGEFTAAFQMFPAIYTTIFLFVVIGLNFIDKTRNYHKLIIGLAITNTVIMLAAYLSKIL